MILGACSLKKMVVQVPLPPEIQIPDSIQSIAILNRSLNANSGDTKDSLVPKQLSRKTYSRKTYYDIAASDSALLSAARTIYDSQRFDVVVPLQRNIYREDHNVILEPLDSAYLQNVCKDFNVEAVLVLENFSEKTQYCFGEIRLINTMIWRFCQPGLFPLSILTEDTLYWYYDLDLPYKKALKKLPSLKEMLIQGAIFSGENIARQIGCIWEDRRRYYFKTGKKKVDAAIPLIESNQWEEASDLWLKYSSASSRSLRGKIEFNLALASEMTGDIDRAIDWANKSYQTKPLSNTKKYLKELNDRKTFLCKLN